MMTMSRLLLVAITSIALMGFSSAAEPATTLTVPDLDCPSCAKKLAAKLGVVAGVATVEPNVEAKTVKVTPKAGSSISPKELWEASDLGGWTPTKLEGPSGTFTEKPAK